MPLRWKDTLVVLLPKVQNAHYPHHFRPISLCTTAYKIVAKILVNRMKEILGPLIAKEQAAFVPDRNIADNCILAQEVMHRFRTSASTSGLMALKIDMEQAYDRMRWDFLVSMLQHFNFPTAWINWIIACISGPRFAFMFNGHRSPWIKATCGFRQGCPLSPLSVYFMLGAAIFTYSGSYDCPCSSWHSTLFQ
ncbi:integrator complex subunit 11 [Apostasia shenzhenica]|uniref:Integrator complex subunit 11 n=1 Tax=Apostasia shenzhenica TaxID=1088818 RepID=A0A2I0B2T2_9ASPA|nr:integrator complex subunit 11 [Apostasia shenzhenica]